MSATTRSTMIGVSGVLTSWNSSVSAALPRSSSSSGGVSFSACSSLLRQFEQLLQELDAVQLARLVRSFSASSRSDSCLNLGLPMCLRSRRIELDLDLLGLLRVGVRQHRLEQIGVEHERVQVVADGVDVDVLVDQLDGLGAERVPEQLARAAGRLDRDVDLREPAVVGLERPAASGRARWPPRACRGRCTRRRRRRARRCWAGTPARRSGPRSPSGCGRRPGRRPGTSASLRAAGPSAPRCC